MTNNPAFWSHFTGLDRCVTELPRMASAVQPTAALPEDVPYKIEKVEVPQPDDNLVLVDSA